MKEEHTRPSCTHALESLFAHALLTSTQLVHGYGFDVSLLPSRGLLSRFSRPKKGYLEEMQRKLEEMLMTVVQKFEVPPMELLKFVEYPFTVSCLYAHTYTTHTHVCKLYTHTYMQVMHNHICACAVPPSLHHCTPRP